ncbi:MAG: hypothetical protein B6U69_01275 [Thermofilum sp. ex4484_15]|nr:MAG: hypothetical protein B6U69_01275 [Thermofilum sp. ex4484_15]
MKVFFKEVRVATSKKFELVDITSKVEEAVRESGVKDGICLVFSPHSTVALIVNEREEGLMEDLITKVREEYPEDRGWKHNLIDDNAHAHLASSFISTFRVFPVEGGRLIRGTWQNVFLLELDGPRSARRVLIEVLGI